MMKEEFDFTNVGKRMPYQVPSEFFDKITEITLAEAERRAGAEKKHQISLLWALSVAASVTLLLAVGYFVYTGSTKEEMVVQSVSKEVPVAVVPHVSEVPAVSDTMTRPEAKVAEQEPALIAETKPVKEKVTQEIVVQETSKSGEPASFDAILKSMSDEEILQLAALAEADLYVYEETFSDE